MKSYILVITSAILTAIGFAFSKQYEKKAGVSASAGLCFNAVSGIITLVAFWMINGFKFNCTPFSFAIAFFVSLCGIIYTVIGFKILKEGNMAVYTLFLMTGGMILPYVWGLLFLHETISILRVIGLILILSAILLTNGGKIKPTKKQLTLCILVFIFNGLISILSKAHQINEQFAVVSSTEFVMLTGITKFLIAGIALLFVPKHDRIIPDLKIVFSLSFAVAITSGIGYMFQLIGAVNLPATVLYPITTGGCIIFSALAGRICFKDIVSKEQWISIALCFIGTCMFM